MSVALELDPGARPEAATHVRLESFDGPLALLLQLIEQRQLDVLSVPLGDLAGAYLEQIAHLPGDRMPHLSAFVSVASQLILLKSRQMLPRPPEPAAPSDEGADPEEELRQRLILYRAYRDAGAWLRDRLEAAEPLFHREASVAAAAGREGARPPAEPPLDPTDLGAALEALGRIVPPPEPPPEIVARTITLAECADAIRDALRGAPAVVLQEIVRGTRDRVLVAVTFLAMLELVKRREVVAAQDQPWGPISVRLTTPDERRAAGVDDSLAHEPLDEALTTFA